MLSILFEFINHFFSCGNFFNKSKYDDYRKVLNSLDQEQDEAYADMKKNIIEESQYQRIIEKIKTNRRYYTGLIEKCSDTIC